MAPRRGARRRSATPWPSSAASSAHTGSSTHSTFGPGDLAQVGAEAGDDPLEAAVVVEVVGLDVGEDRASSGSSRNVPSLSSASTTSHSAPVQWAPVPTSLTSPPTTKLGSHPAVGRIIVSIEVVVVLPWVPATATVRAQAQIDASIPARRSIGDARRARAATSSTLEAGIAVDPVTASMPVDERRVVADVHGDAGDAQPVEHRRLAEVAARHGVAHLGEDEGDGAHARAADADDVEPQRWGRQVERGDGLGERAGSGRSIARDRRPSGWA